MKKTNWKLGYVLTFDILCLETFMRRLIHMPETIKHIMEILKTAEEIPLDVGWKH